MKFEDLSVVQTAWSMLLNTISPYQDTLDVSSVVVRNSHKKDIATLVVYVKPTRGEIDQVAAVIADFTTNLERQCFEFYQQRGILLVPKIEAQPQA